MGEEREFSEIPGPGRGGFFGDLPTFREKGILNTVVWAAEEYGDTVRFRFMVQKAVLFRRPEDIQHVLVTNHRNYLKQTRGYRAMRYLMGNGLVTSEGDFWLRQRRIAQPAFHRKRIREFGETMATVAAERGRRWEAQEDGAVVSMAPEMMEVALDIVGRTLLSADLVEKSSRVAGSLELVLEDVVSRTNKPIFVPLWVPGERNRRVREAIGTLVELVDGVIQERREGKDNPPDLLTMLMDAVDEETGESMSDEQLRDEVMTIFLAGHETTAAALSWVWYLLAKHPEVEARLHEEVDRVLGGRLPGVEDLEELPWTRMIIEEAMRLYPPVHMVARMSQEEDVVGGYRIPPKTFVFVCPYVTHRHPEFWEDPERFDPERFREKKSERPRFAYFPFLGGPRQCIGNTFALMEAQIVLATLASRYRMELVDEGPLKMDVTITMRPGDGLPMRLWRR